MKELKDNSKNKIPYSDKFWRGENLAQLAQNGKNTNKSAPNLILFSLRQIKSTPDLIIFSLRQIKSMAKIFFL